MVTAIGYDGLELTCGQKTDGFQRNVLRREHLCSGPELKMRDDRRHQQCGDYNNAICDQGSDSRSISGVGHVSSKRRCGAVMQKIAYLDGSVSA